MNVINLSSNSFFIRNIIERNQIKSNECLLMNKQIFHFHLYNLYIYIYIRILMALLFFPVITIENNKEKDKRSYFGGERRNPNR